ncbi:hypothetical protein BH10PLA1_BH10PLA1_18130 [soil metagenome]
MIAAAIPDIDGLGILAWPVDHDLGQELYWRYHHVVGHGILFGLIACGLLTAFSQHKPLAFLLYLGVFHLHLLMDFFGSGEGWVIHYGWPISNVAFSTSLVWPLDSWQNKLTAGLLLLWTIAIARYQHRTPLELIAPRLDERLVRARLEE